MHTADILRQARQLYAKHPTRNAMARDENGLPCSPNSPTATCWCAFGALMVVGGNNLYWLKAADVLKQAAAPQSIFAFNDTRPQIEVLAVFDKAIEEACKPKTY